MKRGEQIILPPDGKLGIHFPCWNHATGGKETLWDIIHCIAGMANERGHMTSRHDTQTASHPAWINMVFEGFTEQSLDELRYFRLIGSRFGLIMTEQLGDTALNGDRANADMVGRQKILPRAMRHAEFVLCLVPGTAAEVRRRGWHDKVADLDVGHCPLRDADLAAHHHDVPLDDVAFFGGENKFRHHTIERLRRRGMMVVTPRELPKHTGRVSKAAMLNNIYEDTTQTEVYGSLKHRNDTVLSARCVVDLRPGTWRRFPSFVRLNIAATLRRPAVAEDTACQTTWRQIVPMALGEEFLATVERVVNNWQTERNRQRALFAQLLPGGQCFERAMAQIGIAA